MADIFTQAKRSAVMARIRGSGNRDTEFKLISIFRANNITGWRRGSRLFGKPDFIFRKVKLAIFVDGCFWHRCPLHATNPKTRVEFWQRKLTSNVNRDRQVNRELRKNGWRVLRIWEHELKRLNNHRLLSRLNRAISLPIRLTQSSI